MTTLVFRWGSTLTFVVFSKEFLMKEPLFKHRFLSKTPIALHISKIAKTARQGKLRAPVELTKFSDNNIYACHHKDLFLEKTKAWRKNKGQLFVSFISPHKFATTHTVSRWIVEVLSLSGLLLLFFISFNKSVLPI